MAGSHSQAKAYEDQMLSLAREYFAIAKEVLLCYGAEGDEGGPLEELEDMRRNLLEDGR
jgi:hypothetical protein